MARNSIHNQKKKQRVNSPFKWVKYTAYKLYFCGSANKTHKHNDHKAESSYAVGSPRPEQGYQLL